MSFCRLDLWQRQLVERRSHSQEGHCRIHVGKLLTERALRAHLWASITDLAASAADSTPNRMACHESLSSTVCPSTLLCQSFGRWLVLRETIINLEWLKEEKISRHGSEHTVVERSDGAET